MYVVGPDPWRVLVEARKGGAEEVQRTIEEGNRGPWAAIEDD